MMNGIATVTGNRSMNCGHCAAVCPVDAVRVAAIDSATLSFDTFEIDKHWLPHGEFNISELVRLMASRRSCRNYLDKTVSRETLQDLIKIGVTAPSGTNSQLWTFTLLPNRKSVLELGQHIGLFFRHLNKMAEKPWLRVLLRWQGKRQLDDYYREHYESVKQALEDWEKSGRDRLFHGAPAAIVVGSKPGGACPKEDALLATQNILLAAHCLGLGTCLIGYAVSVMAEDRNITRQIGIPDEESVHAVIALGYPDEEYQTVAGRKKIVPRYFEC
jgi:nitroreductase